MAQDLNSAVLAACAQLLQPLVRLMLNSGVTWKDFAETAKTAFVDFATHEFGIRGRPTNISRVSILTGITRRDVRKQRQLLASVTAPTPTYLSSATRVLTGWHLDPDFADPGSGPRLLGVSGEGATFESLWRRYGGDVPMNALLKELRSVGALEEAGNGTFRVLKRNYIPLQIDPDKTLRAGDVLRDIGNTVVFDLIAPRDAPLRFERRATNAFVDADTLPAFNQLLEREGQAFLERIDTWLSAHAVPAGEGRDAQRMRLGVGVYHIQDPHAPPRMKRSAASRPE